MAPNTVSFWEARFARVLGFERSWRVAPNISASCDARFARVLGFERSLLFLSLSLGGGGGHGVGQRARTPVARAIAQDGGTRYGIFPICLYACVLICTRAHIHVGAWLPILVHFAMLELRVF